ncbi:MAG: glutamate--cysteine ligase [Spirochaetaceae bacterium]|nr:glutamate--cysteine ligase [Spirochaetaceae bacterium]
MGIEIDRTEFDDEDRARFARRLGDSLEVLEALLARPGFGAGEATLGAELEVSLVGPDDRARPRNVEVLRESVDPRLTVELDRFNLEANLAYGPLAGASFTRLIDECHDCLAELERACALHGVRPAMIGILPTLSREELEGDAMTSSLRYEALSRALRGLRDAPFSLDIHGEDILRLDCEDVTFEGAATSFQLHLRVAPDDFARVYDAIQLATPAALALGANSPTFLGHRLWDETRIALFKQAVDHRAERGRDGRPARVSFGTSWTPDPLELFREPVLGHPPLLPVLDVEEPREALAGPGAPGLRELRLHQGTVWRWNRAIYDPAGGGHLRIEMRALPAGPSVIDMVASAAFLIGLGLDTAARDEAGEWRRTTPFERVHADFYRAARQGVDVELEWPAALGGSGDAEPLRRLAPKLLARAEAGLLRAGVDAGDASRLLAIVERRAGTGQTAAVWQRRALAAAERTRPRAEAIAAMFRAYLERSRSGEPVDRWSLPA